MENTLEFQQNAIVFTASGEQIGNVTRVVMHPDTKVVTHIVARKKGLFERDERLIPIEQIAETSGALITLSEAAENLDDLPPFEEKHFILDDRTSEGGAAASQIPTAYGVPLVATGSRNPSADRYITVFEQNIPPGTVAVKEGAKVVTAEGKTVGKVDSIVADLPADQATHLLVKSGLMAEEKKLVPIRWVDFIEEKEIHLNVNKDSMKALANIDG